MNRTRQSLNARLTDLVNGLIEYWDGNNNVITSTYDRERLYRFAGGRCWILHTYRSYEKGHETYTPITKLEATEWFMQNDLTVPDELSLEQQALEILQERAS